MIQNWLLWLFSDVFAGQLFGQFGVFEEFGMRRLFEASVGGVVLGRIAFSGVVLGVVGRIGGDGSGSSGGSGSGGGGGGGNSGGGASVALGGHRHRPRRVFDEVHFGEMVTVGAFGNELGITEGTLHDRRIRRHHGVVASPAEGQDGSSAARPHTLLPIDTASSIT